MKKSWLYMAVVLTLSALLADPAMAANNELSGPQCRDLGGDMEKGFTTRCAFAQATLEQVYAYLRNHDKDARRYLASTFPAHDAKHTDDKNNVGVDYRWTGKERLDVQLDFAGGSTRYTLRKQGAGVVLTTVMSPD